MPRGTPTIAQLQEALRECDQTIAELQQSLAEVRPAVDAATTCRLGCKGAKPLANAQALRRHYIQKHDAKVVDAEALKGKPGRKPKAVAEVVGEAAE